MEDASCHANRNTGRMHAVAQARLTAEAAVGVRGAVGLAAQKLAALEFVLGLAISAEGEELVVELTSHAVPHADGAERLEYVGEVGGALSNTPVEDGRRDCSKTTEMGRGQRP